MSAYWSLRPQRFVLTAAPLSDLWDVHWRGSTEMSRLLLLFSQVAVLGPVWTRLHGLISPSMRRHTSFMTGDKWKLDPSAARLSGTLQVYVSTVCWRAASQSTCAKREKMFFFYYLCSFADLHFPLFSTLIYNKINHLGYETTSFFL